MPSATRRGVPNRLPSTGMSWPVGRLNSNAGPPARSTRSQISVISNSGDTGTSIRRSSPARSSCPRKSRKSEYFIYFCCIALTQRNWVTADETSRIIHQKHLTTSIQCEMSRNLGQLPKPPLVGRVVNLKITGPVYAPRGRKMAVCFGGS